jgi:hypothetical protein
MVQPRLVPQSQHYQNPVVKGLLLKNNWATARQKVTPTHNGTSL